MGKKRERVRRCKQIRLLIDENKYTKALELIDELPLEEVGSLEDLYLFADLYEKAERLDKKKEIFYLIYERTGSRYVLNRLLRLAIRLGDMEEARELYFAYEVAGDVTLDTFELRYLLAKAEGEPRSRLIEILEDLKREEYTEEWGFQLACLYELEGERDKCIQECKDLKLWFGEGRIVDKAVELQRRCESADWEPPVEEEIPEPIEPDREEVVPYAAPPVDVTEIDEAAEQEEPEPGQQEQEEPEETHPKEQDREEQEQEKPVSGIWEKKPQDMDAMLDSAIAYGESVSEPVVAKKGEPLEVPPRKGPEKKEQLLEEDPEDISRHGISYRTLKSAINHVRYDDQTPHFVFAGGEERITLAVAKRLTKELNNVGYMSVRSIVKITADKLNQIDLSEQVEKLAGGCMLVTNASEMNKKAVDALVDTMNRQGSQLVVMLSAPFDEMDCFLDIYPELSDKLTYKIRM